MKERERAERAHEIAQYLGIGFDAAWKISSCICKVCYKTERDAARAAGEANMRWERKQKPYRCPICGRWHLTTDGEA